MQDVAPNDGVVTASAPHSNFPCGLTGYILDVIGGRSSVFPEIVCVFLYSVSSIFNKGVWGDLRSIYLALD